VNPPQPRNRSTSWTNQRTLFVSLQQQARLDTPPSPASTKSNARAGTPSPEPPPLSSASEEHQIHARPDSRAAQYMMGQHSSSSSNSNQHVGYGNTNGNGSYTASGATNYMGRTSQQQQPL